MSETALATPVLLGLALALGVLFGGIGQKTHFCTMGAIADIVNMGDWTRMRMWLLAIATALLGATSLQALGLIDLGKSIYRGANLLWLSHLVGGLCFGVGMVLASGCGGKTLIRVGGGNLKSLVVLLVMAISAYMSLRGLFAVLRVNYLDVFTISLSGGQDIPARLLAEGFAPGLATWLPALVIGLGLLLFALSAREARSFDSLLAGIGSGLVVVLFWYVSGHLGYVAEDTETLQEAFIATNSGRMESLTFVAPPAFALDLLLLWSDSSRKLSLGVASLLGVLLGAWVWALVSRRFRWESFRDAADMGRHLLGAVLMGFGGVTAMGCTIGQGITGVSTLALGSFISLFAIIAGAVAMLRYDYWRLMRAD